MIGLKMLKWIGWGLGIWGIGLFWPEVNQSLSTPAMLGLVLALGAIILAYRIGCNLLEPKGHKSLPQRPKVEQKHTSRPSRPVPPLSMA